MKKIFISLFIFSLFVFNTKVSASSLEFTAYDNGRVIQVTRGQVFTIKIGNPGDGGYIFNNPSYDTSVLTLTNHTHTNPSIIIPGNFGDDVWEFQALNSGSTKIDITASRQWTGGDTANMFSATVVVSNSNIDYGCLNGENYSTTTGQFCYNNKTNNPTISGVSGPQLLNINQTGTWTVNATNLNNGNLFYSVDWGDTLYTATPQVSQQILSPQNQSAVFTHSYSYSGNYSPKFTVTSENSIRCITVPCPSNAGSSSTSISVKVVNTTIDNGCYQGDLYNKFTGQRCSVISDYGCLNGNIYSYTTGQICNYTNNSIRRTLRRGFRGDDVIFLQKFLGANQDGVYGRDTTLKVMNWQILNGLNPDGVFGYRCRQKAGFEQ